MGWHKNGQNVLALTYRDSENRLKSQAYIPSSTPFLVELPMRREWKGFEISREEKTKEKTRPAFESKYQQSLGSTVRNFRDYSYYTHSHASALLWARGLFFLTFPPIMANLWQSLLFWSLFFQNLIFPISVPKSPNIVTKSQDHARQCVKTSLGKCFLGLNWYPSVPPFPTPHTQI